jgi:hypothetical protein
VENITHMTGKSTPAPTNMHAEMSSHHLIQMILTVYEPTSIQFPGKRRVGYSMIPEYKEE